MNLPAILVTLAGAGLLLSATPAPGAPVHELVWGFGVPPQNPGYGALTLAPDGWYWGTTLAGGVEGKGTIYKVKPDGSDWQTVHSCSQSSFQPNSGLAADGLGNLWGTTYYGTGGSGTVFKVNVTTGVFTVVVEFRSPDGFSRGSRTTSHLYNDGAGYMWGTTLNNGNTYNGAVFKVNIASGALTIVADLATVVGPAAGFNPFGGLVSDGAGQLWGTTESGGTGYNGTVFKVNMSTGALTMVTSFPNSTGGYPKARLTPDGKGYMWGTGTANKGTIFKVNQTTGVISAVLNFSGDGAVNKGEFPYGELLLDDAGLLWGTTARGGSGAGTVFKLNPATGVLTTVVQFPRLFGDYSGPYAGLVSDGAGSFLGTTHGGPSGYPNGRGSVFKLHAASGVVTTLTSFVDDRAGSKGHSPRCGLVADGMGRLWGTTEISGWSRRGTIFRIDPVSGFFETVVDFEDYYPAQLHRAPSVGLTRDTFGQLWGAALGGGRESKGSIFKINPKSGTLSSVAEFTGPNSGASPLARLISDGAGGFVGTTQSGGAYDDGTVFRVDARTGALITIVDFDRDAPVNNGAGPFGELYLDGEGWLWGTTVSGGTLSNGTVFKLNPETRELLTVINFTGTAGANKGSSPYNGLVPDGNGYLWGTTRSGGVGGSSGGTIFKLLPETGVMTTLHEWECFSYPLMNCPRAQPLTGLVPDGAGFLWGTTSAGGAYRGGTVFKIHATTGEYTKLVDFPTAPGVFGSSWYYAEGSLLLHTDGNWYGTTSNGGPYGGGTIYRLRNGPTPVTGTAEVNGSTATLHGTLNAHGTESLAFLEWGTDPFLNVFETVFAGTVAGNDPLPATAVLTGLTQGTTYYYRAAGSNPDNVHIQRGAIRFFPGRTALETWRLAHFATTANAGAAANFFDADGDGLVNLLEFAFGLNPLLADSRQLPEAQITDGQLAILFTPPPEVQGVCYAAEWSQTLQPGSWQPVADSGTTGLHWFRIPHIPGGSRFIRLRVTLE